MKSFLHTKASTKGLSWWLIKKIFSSSKFEKTTFCRLILKAKHFVQLFQVIWGTLLRQWQCSYVGCEGVTLGYHRLTHHVEYSCGGECERVRGWPWDTTGWLTMWSTVVVESVYTHNTNLLLQQLIRNRCWWCMQNPAHTCIRTPSTALCKAYYGLSSQTLTLPPERWERVLRMLLET